jgi:crotonobetainyl-CoA:carnitine CoA-transferase CaiB-like acyl-CoA transferase
MSAPDPNAATTALPLAGIRVLDLTRILAGPWATQNLADLGAEVIKIEHPQGGDDTRKMGPPFVKDAVTGEDADAAYFLAANRGKQSVAIDFTCAQGRQLVLSLAARCDVLVENYKVGGLAKYGLDYASVHAQFPDLIYCSITGFGQTGPYSQRAGYDYLIQGMGGLMSVTGEPDGVPGGGPQRAGVALADILSGMYASLAIVAALRHRDTAGGGQHIDIGMLDVQVATLANQAMNYLTTTEVPKRMGKGHLNIVPYGAFPAADGHLILAVGNDAQFKKMAGAMNRPDIGQDPRFATIAQRVAHRDVLVPMLEAITSTRTIDEWVAAMEAVDVPCGPINTIDRVFADAQVRARGIALELPHLQCASVPSVASPMRFSQTPLRYTQAPPVLGQHTREVLGRLLGLEASQLQALVTKGTSKATP